MPVRKVEDCEKREKAKPGGSKYSRFTWFVELLAIALAAGTAGYAQKPDPAQRETSRQTWQFLVSGDSRNCGDVIMPAIAAGALRDHAGFYWHLGDLRLISDFDQDYKQLGTHNGKPPTIIQYESEAWRDFIEHQMVPFGSLPFFLGIGNHETTPPKTRAEFITAFADWLDTPELQAQRLHDDPKDHRLKTYYHWVRDGIDFINLDNASADQFDDDQLRWLESVLARDAHDDSIRTVVAGMHEALPDSIGDYHSMSESPRGLQTGRRVYQDLLKLQNEQHKKIYVLASHSHFFMDGIFNTEYLREHGDVLPGWIVGTAGAARPRLPADSANAKAAKTDVYGYLLGTVNPSHADPGTIHFQFRQIDRPEIPADVVQSYTPAFVDECFSGNRQ